MMFTEQGISGQVFTTLESLMFRYGQAVFNSLSKGFLTLLSLFLIFQLSHKIIKNGMMYGSFKIHDISTPLISSSICTTLLSSFSVLETWLFKPFYDLSINICLQAVKASSRGNAVNSIVGMLNEVESSLYENVFKVTKTILSDAHWYETFHGFFACLIMDAPFMFVWVLFVCLMVDCLFKFVAVFAISPLIIICFPFAPTRGIAISGLRIFLNAILTMFFAGIAMGFTMAIMKFSGLCPSDGNSIKPCDWFFSQQYWAMFLVGCVSIIFHLKAPKIAANLSSIDDGAGVVGSVAALGTMGLMGAKTMFTRSAGKAGGYAARKVRQGLSEGSQRLLDKMRGH